MFLSYPLRLLILVLAYVASRFVANRLVLAFPCAGHDKVNSAVAWIRLWGRRLGLDELLRIAYYLLVPFVVLQLGWASPPDLGLANLDWVRGIGAAVALTVAALVPLLWIWRRYAGLVGESGKPLVVMEWTEPWGWTRSLREAILLEASWALIRSAAVVSLGGHWGTWIGLGMILASVLLDPRMAQDLRVVGRREGPLLAASIALVTTTVFWGSRNLWLSCAAHVTLRSAVLSMMSRTGAEPGQGRL